MLAGFTTEGLILIVVMVAAVSLIMQMAYRRIVPDRSIAGNQLEARILQLQRDLGTLEQAQLALRDDYRQLEHVVRVRGMSSTGRPTSWDSFDARLKALQAAVADLAGLPTDTPKDARPSQWQRIAEDEPSDEPPPGVR